MGGLAFAASPAATLAPVLLSAVARGVRGSVHHRQVLAFPSPAPAPVFAAAGETGFIGWREIKQWIADGARVVENRTALAAYVALGDQWASFDTKHTLALKMQAASSLGGFMVGLRAGGLHGVRA